MITKEKKKKKKREKNNGGKLSHLYYFGQLCMSVWRPVRIVYPVLLVGRQRTQVLRTARRVNQVEHLSFIDGFMYKLYPKVPCL